MNSSFRSVLLSLRSALEDSQALHDLEVAECALNDDEEAKTAYAHLQSIEEKVNLHPDDRSLREELSLAKKAIDELPVARTYMAAYLNYCALIDKVNATLFLGEGLLMRYKGC